MKYYESRFTKFIGSTGFYAVIACCIIAIGAASWFAVSRYNKAKEPENVTSKQRVISSENSAYTESTESVPEIIMQPVESANNTVTDEPYVSSQETAPTAPAAESFAMPVEGEISKDFSLSQLQYSSTYSDMRLHKGIDISCEKGTDVKSCGEGTVKSVEESASLGNVVVIDHGNCVEIKYCGLGDVAVQSSQTVKTGTVLGVVSEIPCECADQSHLHIEVYKDGAAIAPSDIIK